MWLSDTMLAAAMFTLATAGAIIAFTVTRAEWRVSFVPDDGSDPREMRFAKKPGIYEAIAKLHGRGTADEEGAVTDARKG